MLHIFVREIVKNIIMNETEKGMSKDQEKELIRLCAHLDELVERLGKAEGRLKEFNNRMLAAEPIPDDPNKQEGWPECILGDLKGKIYELGRICDCLHHEVGRTEGIG